MQGRGACILLLISKFNPGLKIQSSKKKKKKIGDLFSKNKGAKKKPASRVSSRDRAVLELKVQRDKLRKYQDKVRGMK
jgi:hypothetical protein